MDIDIYDYIDRYEINYIVYHKEHLRAYGDVSNAISRFDGKYYEQIEEMAGDRVYDVMEADYRGNKAAGVLSVIDSLQNGTMIDDIMDKIAEGINEGLDASAGKVDWENYESIIQSAKSFSDLFNAENFDARLHQFMNLILSAMKEANLLSLEVLDALTNIGTRLSGTNFKIAKSWKKGVIPLSREDQKSAQKVIDYLSNAADKVEAGTMNARSFAVTINNIFTKAIGNKFYDTIIANGLAEAQRQSDSIFNQLVESGKMKWVDRGGSIPPPAGSLRTNIVSSPLLSLVAVQNGQQYEIEIANSTDISWPSKTMDKGEIKLIGKSKVGEMFNGQPDKYLAYNMIAHRGVGVDFDEAFSRIRAYTAASFLKGWVNGNHFKTSSGKKAQFLMIRGRIYSVQRIIKNICDEVMRNGAEDMISIGGRGSQTNKWVGKQASISNALNRSAKVNKVIETLTIAATLNNNILEKYAY